MTKVSPGVILFYLLCRCIINLTNWEGKNYVFEIVPGKRGIICN